MAKRISTKNVGESFELLFDKNSRMGRKQTITCKLIRIEGEGDRQQYQRGKTLQVRHVADSLTQGSRHCPRGALGSGRRPRTEGSNQRKLFRGASFEFGGLHQMLTASLRAVSVCSHPAPAPRKRTFPSLPCSSSPLQRVDRRIHSGLPRHLPTDVALQKRVSFG